MKAYYLYPDDDFRKLQSRLSGRKRDLIKNITHVNMKGIQKFVYGCDYECVYKVTQRFIDSIHAHVKLSDRIKYSLPDIEHCNPYVKIISDDVELALEKLQSIECENVTDKICNIIQNLLQIPEIWNNTLVCKQISTDEWHQLLTFQVLVESIMSDITGRRLRLAQIPEILSNPKNTVYLCWQYK